MTEKKDDMDKRVESLEKGVKNVAFTLRKIKNWLENIHGADIDGDGQIGKASEKGRSSLIAMLVLFLLGTTSVFAASAYILNLSPSGARYPFSVGVNKITYVENITVSNAVVFSGTLEITGKATLNGELEVNNDVDINLTATTHEIVITQTNATGADGVPMASITDARTGTFADAAAEASLVITAAGAYGLSVADGIVNIEGEIDSTGDITLDPAGGDVIVDGTVDATAYTAAAGSGIDVKTAGALDIGNTTATSIDYGSAAVTAHTFVADGTGDGKVVLPLLSVGDGEINDVSAAKLTAATVATAIDINAATNIDMANLAAGTTAAAFNGSAITALDAAHLTAGSVVSVIDLSAGTNIAGGNIASGNIDIARIAEALKAPGTIGGTTPGDASFASAAADSLAVGDKSGQAGTVAVRDGTIDTFTINAAGMVDIGAWGYTGEHVGLVDDGSGNTVPGFGQYNEVKTEIAGSKVLAAKYTRLLCSSNQVNSVTMIGHESQFRLRGANLADGVHVGLWAYAEQSGTSVLSDNGTFDAILATVESENTFTVGATEQVTGITLDSSIGASASIAGAANFSAAYIKSNGKDWFNGIYITGCNNDILLDGGATIDQSAADTLTFTEDNVGVAGAFTATSYEGVVAATLIAGAAAGTTAAQPEDCFGSATSVNGAIASAQLIVTNAITMKDVGGTTKTGYALTRVWMSETAYGTASTNNIETLALSTGTQVEEVLAAANYWYVTASDGTAIATITATATGTNYINVAVGPNVTATEIIFIP